MSAPLEGNGLSPKRDFGSQVAELTSKLEEAVNVMAESKESDGARWAEANKARIELGQQVQALVEKQEAEERASATEQAVKDLNDFLSQVRTPSGAKAAAIGGNILGDYSPAQVGPRAGDFISAVWLSRSSDFHEQMAGKAKLEQFGLKWEDPWGEGGPAANPNAVAGTRTRVESNPNGGFAVKADTDTYAALAAKATLGTSAATGQDLIPNAIVDALTKPAMYDHPFRSLLTVVPGVTSYAVDMPVRASAPSRAVIAAFGNTKENRDLTYQAYSATMYTMALIYDLGKQFLRQSAGAAEQDVMGELAHAFALGEAYYILSGSGSSEPYGILTGLTATSTDYLTSHTAAATIAGAAATAIAKSAGFLARRNRVANGVLVNAADYWTMVAQGADAAGYYIAGNANGPANVNPGSGVPGGPAGLRIWGLPVYPDTTIASDRMVVGDWKAAKLFLGESYRVDSSDVAGERWDKNLVGFRGEMEIGFDARPAILSGAFQDVTNFVP